MDTMKIARGVYQHTAIDDCSRFRVLPVYPRANARNTLLILDRISEEMPFLIELIQTDRGGEFFANTHKSDQFPNVRRTSMAGSNECRLLI